MTKEQILKKHRSHNDEDTYAAMEEYAKQEAMGFHKWYRPFVQGKLEQCIEDKEQWLAWVNKPYEEYWELYLQSKQ